MKQKVVIVGGVAGGASCAARLRRLDEEAEIVLLEKGPYISFANCGLPYHIGGVIEERKKLLVQTPRSFQARFRVDVRVNSEVLSIDRDSRTLQIRTENGEATESYDTLVLSTGSVPFVPKLPGSDSNRILQLWNLGDMDRILTSMESLQASSVIVIGGGFVGLETAENLSHRGLQVTIVEMQNQVLPSVDYELAQYAHKALAQAGIKLVLGEGVQSFEENADGITAVTSGHRIKADLIITAIGVRPNTALAAGCGLTLNARGGVVVNEHLQTSDPHIYAVGDMVETTNFVTGKPAMIPLAGPANKMGRMAADNICGLNRAYRGTQGASVVKLFDLTLASVGLNERQLLSEGKRFGVDYYAMLMRTKDHAGYYPGAQDMNLKLLFDPAGKVLGAEACGYSGIEKRIDVISTAMRFGATIYDLQETELCYAPPYSSAKDPVNMAAFAAVNQLSGLADSIGFAQLEEARKDAVLLDVRTVREYAAGDSLPGSINIPLDSLREKLDELDKEKSYLVFCKIGLRGYLACRILKQHGFSHVTNLQGGVDVYTVASGAYTEA